MSTWICVNVLILQTASGAKLLILQTRPLLFLGGGSALSLILSLCLSLSREAEVDKWKTNRAITTLNGEPTLSWHRGYSTHTPETHTWRHTHTDQSVISWHMQSDSLQGRRERETCRGTWRETNAVLYSMCVPRVTASHLIN